MGLLARSLIIIFLPITAAYAQQEQTRFELTPFAGYTVGGEVENSSLGETLELEDDASFGVILNIRHSSNTQWEILYSRQATKLNPGMLDLDAHYLQAGGTYLGGGDYARPYLALTLGASHFEPGLGGVSSETFFAFSVGAGFHFRPNARLGMRLEARGYGTLLESDSDLFCRTGPDQNICVIQADGKVLWQLQTFAGIVFRF